MRKFLLVLYCLGCIQSFGQVKRLIDYTLWKTFTTQDLRDIMKQNKIPKALVNVKYSVDIYDITYYTQWHDGTMVKASGLYFVPKGITMPMPQLFYGHGTRTQPGRKEKLGGEEFFSLGFAMDGYLVLFPDYVGLGRGEKFHIWQNVESEGLAVANMLYAVRELNDLLGIKTNGQLFLTGYSQGGHATMSAHKVIQEKFAHDFTVTASAPMSGAYDMTHEQAQVMFEKYPQPFYLPYLLYGVNEVYKFTDTLANVYVSPYDSLIPLMFDGKHNIKQINGSLPDTPALMLKKEWVEKIKNDTGFILNRALRENSPYNWKPERPMLICYCEADEEVKAANARYTYQTMKNLGARHVRILRAAKKYGHNKCSIFTTLYAKFYFDSFRKGSKYGRKGNVGKRILLSFAKLAIRP